MEQPTRARVLATLRASAAPLGVADIAAELGIHRNTARFHLDALVAAGTAARVPEPPSGPGRPRAGYQPRPGMDRGGVRDYQLLAQILLSQLAAAGPGAGESAVQAARAWGGYLAGSPPPLRQLTGSEAVGRLMGLLTDLGFDPEPGPASGKPAGPAMIRLRHCPFLELAEEHQPLVCRLHLGLMQGALAKLEAPVSAAALEPFAEPGACLALLEPASAA